MASSICGTYKLLPPKKRPFGDDNDRKQCQGFSPNFKRQRIFAVRDFPRFCGPPAPENNVSLIAGNLEAPMSMVNSFGSGKLQSTATDAEVTMDTTCLPPCEVSKDYPGANGIPAGFNSVSSYRNNITYSSVKFSAEPKPLGQEVEAKHAPKRSPWDSTMDEYVHNIRDAGEICNLMAGQDGGFAKEIGIIFHGRGRNSFKLDSCCQSMVGNRVNRGKSSVLRSARKGGDEICSKAEYAHNIRDAGEISDLVAGQDGGVAKEIGIIFHGRGRNSGKLDSCCRSTVGNRVDQGKSCVLRSARKGGDEICSKDHQTIVNSWRVQEALNLFHALSEKLPHAKAAMKLKQQQKWVNATKRLGHVPGIEIGDTFRFRVELSIIGLHSPFVHGIDYMVMRDGKTLAISVVDSGRYANDKESSDVLIYSGEGGNPNVGGHKLAEDQKLERGNLALKNSMDAGTPVRVILGSRATKMNPKGYTYDGLYFVDRYWQERSKFDKLIFKFEMKRIRGQPMCYISEPKISRPVFWETRFKYTSHNKKESKRLTRSKSQRRTMLNDISWGKEERPIPVVNIIDDEEPRPFTYISRMAYSESSNRSISNGCDCTNGCSDSVKCACVLKNGRGGIHERNRRIYECGPWCQCPPSCANRVSQNGIRFQLEVFRTRSTGWGVRSRNYIPYGSFICEYVGELIHDKEAERRVGNDEYLFDLGGGMNSSELPSMSNSKAKDYGEFAIDAARFGNVGRFINHSCSPNLYAQKVLYDHEDKRLPHIMLFAAKNILPMQELTYDYNYTVDEVRDFDGKIKKKRCYCGSRECTGWMY